MPPNSYIRPNITAGDVKYNVQYTHSKDDNGLPIVYVCLRFWHCDELMHDTENFTVEMKNDPNQQNSQWKIQFASDTEGEIVKLNNVSETWDVVQYDCPWRHESVPLHFCASIDEGENLDIFYQNDRKVVYFTTVCHDLEGKDKFGKMVPAGLKWTRVCSQWTPEGYKPFSSTIQH